MDTIVEEKDGNFNEIVSPPTPDIEKDARIIGDGWNEYSTPYGRPYYYNSETGEKSWKPPRRKLLIENNDNKTDLRLKTYSLPADASASYNLEKLPSELSLPNECFTGKEDENFQRSFDLLSTETEIPKNVGKILRTGKLNTALVTVNGKRVKKKWVTSFAVLTEYYMMFTTQSGFLKRLFQKSKRPKANRFYLPEASINKENESSKRENVYRLSTRKLSLSRDSVSADICDEILFQSNNAIEAETWYHALSLIITDLKSPKRIPRLRELKERNVRPRSWDIFPGCGPLQNNRSSFTMSYTDSTDDILIDNNIQEQYRSLSRLKVKFPTPPGYVDKYDSTNNLFYYINCITGEKWFAKATDDGKLYFTHKESGRSSWLLPSIYVDATPRILKRMKRWTIHTHSLKVTDV